MDSTIIAAIIGASALILINLMNRIFIYFSESIKYMSISKSRRKTLENYKWMGEAADIGKTSEESFKYSFNGVFKTSKRKIKGTADIIRSDKETYQIEYYGGMISDSFIRLNYHNKDKSVLRYGVLFLKLSSTGDQINGKFLGYGSVEENFVEGEVYLERMNI